MLFRSDRQKAPLVTVECSESVERAARLMTERAYSQLPVVSDGRLVGSVNEGHLYAEIVKSPDVLHGPVEAIMQPAFPFVDISTPVELLSTMIKPGNAAVLVRDFKTDKTYIITRSDLIRVLGS